MAEEFKRTIEDFTCGHCGAAVSGDGYTNHCPRCLWSKHVDIHPGDRAAACEGLMSPEKLEMVAGQFELIHRCVRCGYEKRNKTRPEDDIETYLQGMV